MEEEKWSHRQISEFLSGQCPGRSIRSIQRFCSDRNIHKSSRISDSDFKDAVSIATDMVISSLVCWTR